MHGGPKHAADRILVWRFVECSHSRKSLNDILFSIGKAFGNRCGHCCKASARGLDGLSTKVLKKCKTFVASVHLRRRCHTHMRDQDCYACLVVARNTAPFYTDSSAVKLSASSAIGVKCFQALVANISNPTRYCLSEDLPTPRS